MADYQSTHTGAEIDQAVSKVLDNASGVDALADMVVSGMTFNQSTRRLTITLEGGGTVYATLPLATLSFAGLMSASDKTKLNSALTEQDISNKADIDSIGHLRLSQATICALYNAPSDKSNGLAQGNSNVSTNKVWFCQDGYLYYRGSENQDVQLGTPPYIVYYCLNDNKLYRYNGNGFTAFAISNGGGTFTETDPTVPDWAKAPTKPTYTAQEVGALPADTAIPEVLDVLTSDSTEEALSAKQGKVLNQRFIEGLTVVTNSSDAHPGAVRLKITKRNANNGTITSYVYIDPATISIPGVMTPEMLQRLERAEALINALLNVTDDKYLVSPVDGSTVDFGSVPQGGSASKTITVRGINLTSGLYLNISGDGFSHDAGPVIMASQANEGYRFTISANFDTSVSWGEKIGTLSISSTEVSAEISLRAMYNSSIQPIT